MVPPQALVESFEGARPHLQRWGVQRLDRAWQNLRHLAALCEGQRFAELWRELDRVLPRCPDPDMALNNLERFLSQPGVLVHWPAFLENRARLLETVLQLFSVSQYFSDLLVTHPTYVGMLRIPLRKSPSLEEMEAQLQAEVDAAFEDTAVLRALRRFRERHLMRIGANDIIRGRPLEEVTRDISRVAEAAARVALTTALRRIANRFGPPQRADGQQAGCVLLAFGKLGGEELNYSSDIDLMLVYEEEGVTRGRRPIANSEFFERVVKELVRLLSAYPPAFRVDFRLRPEGQRGPLARALDSTLAYYDTLGRTWERQALIKVRPIAGDLTLGQRFLAAIEPFVYRRYLSFAEINEIKVMRRKIEQKASRMGAPLDIKTGRGGIRDVEFVIQFLQLLNGGDLPQVRLRNTLAAIQALADAGCLTDQERHVLADNYRFLRQLEHRLQVMFDLQTHTLPQKPDELARLARRMGYSDPSPRRTDTIARPGNAGGACAAFLADLERKTELNRRILNHLLHETFADDAGSAEPETDLVLDPDPEPEAIAAILGRYRFRDIERAWSNLQKLAQEEVPFLSTRRCRHFLASIAPRLLQALAQTPDPDMALTNLERVTASLGAKGVLWELFSTDLDSLRLYVDLCAWSQFLSEILVNNPGMIDELIESLAQNKKRDRHSLVEELAELCHGAEDPDVILHSFRDKELLRIGVRDILGRDSLRDTLAQLSDLAEAILGQVAELKWPQLIERMGEPRLAEGPRAGLVSRYVILGLGKLGGREISYGSDLDLILIYEGDGPTCPQSGSSGECTDNVHFFSRFAWEIIGAGQLGPRGRLYTVDMRLRPWGRSNTVTISLPEFRRYYSTEAQLWEKQALTRARVVWGDAEFAADVERAVAEAAYGFLWRPEFAQEIVDMRRRLEQGRSQRDLKRGFGGIVDVEFIVQLLLLKYGWQYPGIRQPNIWAALEALAETGLVDAQTALRLRAHYEFLRRVESRLRVAYGRSQDVLPEREEEIDRLARRLGFQETQPQGSQDASLPPAAAFLEAHERCAAEVRRIFLEVAEREGRN